MLYHSTVSVCECVCGWGGSAGVVNQAAEVSDTASSQHQGSSPPLPAGICGSSTRNTVDYSIANMRRFNKCGGNGSGYYIFIL